jgi:hypothetical protein
MRYSLILFLLLSLAQLGFTNRDWKLVDTVYSAREFVTMQYPELKIVKLKLAPYGSTYQHKGIIRICYVNLLGKKAFRRAVNTVAKEYGYERVTTNAELVRFVVLHEYGHAYCILHGDYSFDYLLEWLKPLQLFKKLIPIVEITQLAYRKRPNEAYADKFSFRTMKQFKEFSNHKVKS